MYNSDVINKKTETKKQEHAFHIALLQQMITLVTNGFGFVAALAWNSVIEEFINTYIKKWLPKDAGILSLLIYALIVTLIAVLLTYNLSKTLKRLQSMHDNAI